MNVRSRGLLRMYKRLMKECSGENSRSMSLKILDLDLMNCFRRTCNMTAVNMFCFTHKKQIETLNTSKLHPLTIVKSLIILYLLLLAML